MHKQFMVYIFKKEEVSMKDEYEKILKKFNIKELDIVRINFSENGSTNEYIQILTPIDKTFLANIKKN